MTHEYKPRKLLNTRKQHFQKSFPKISVNGSAPAVNFPEKSVQHSQHILCSIYRLYCMILRIQKALPSIVLIEDV